MKGIVYDGNELRVREGLEVRAPGAGEVAVRITNSGVCRSDLSVMSGTIPFLTPVVLGHEGAGLVEEVGPGVTHLQPGDHVVLSTLGSCGTCAHCDRGRPTMCRSTFGHRPTPFTLDGIPHYAFANISSFAELTVVKATQAVPIPREVPLSSACLIGCGVLTGAGAVLNRARVEAGESAVVVGVGGIGLNSIQALRLVGADRIIAVDANPAKEAIARQFARDTLHRRERGTRPGGCERPHGRRRRLGLRVRREQARPRGSDHLPRLVGESRDPRRAAIRPSDRGPTRGDLPRQIDHGLSLRREPAPAGHPPLRRVVSVRTFSARRADHAGLSHGSDPDGDRRHGGGRFARGVLDFGVQEGGLA